MIGLVGFLLLIDRKEIANFEKEEKKFYSNSVSGTVISLEHVRQWVIVQISNGEKCYINQAANYSYNPNLLSDFMQIGDSIVKPPFSDSVFIYREQIKFYFIIGDVHLNR